MSEAWVCTELLYNSTPIGSERKRQLNPLLEEGGGGGGCRGVDGVERSRRGSVHGKGKEKKEEKKKRELHRACGERRCGEIRSLNKCDNKIRATKGI